MEFISGNVFIRVMGEGKGLKPGEKVGGHTHNFDHTSIFFCGDWHVRKWRPDNTLAYDFERRGPFHILIEKDSRHEFTFLGGADVGWAWCVYSHRTPQGEVSQVETGWFDAYEANGGPRETNTAAQHQDERQAELGL
jgi:hypothetical protein